MKAAKPPDEDKGVSVSIFFFFGFRRAHVSHGLILSVFLFYSIPHFQHHSSTTFTMSTADNTGPPVVQQFESEDGTPLVSLPTSFCTETNQRFVLWKDIQDQFDGVLHLSSLFENPVEFMIDPDGELYRFSP